MINYSKITKNLLICSVLITLFCLLGCRSTVIVNGESFMALKESEINKLIDRGRFTLQKNRKIFSIEEIKHAQKTLPKVDIQYHGDTSGVAQISWTFPRRTVVFNFSGDLSNETIDCMMQIIRPQPEIIKSNITNSYPKENNLRPRKSKRW
jgi:hypothetical protein